MKVKESRYADVNDDSEENLSIFNVNELTEGDLFHRKLIVKCRRVRKKR